MRAEVVRDFLRLECTPYVRDLLHDAASSIMAGVPPGRREFNFNCFDVTLDAETHTALIEDILDSSNNRKASLDIREFMTALDVK